GIDQKDGTLHLRNTLVANNASGANCQGSILSDGYNLDSGSSCGLPNTGDLVSTDPLLDVLSDNGGETKTHALLTGSPAIDTGDPLNCPSTDQRDSVSPLDWKGHGRRRW